MELLIIKPSSLGDIIHGLQAAQSLKAQRPDVRITWVAREIFAPLAQACACVDEVIVFHRKAGMSGLRQCIREIRQRRYDWVWDMQGLARSGLMTWRARAGKKAGRRDNREGARLAYQLMPQLPAGGKESHALDILLQFLPLLGIEPRVDGPLAFREVESKNLPPEAAGAVVLFPGSRRAEKEWPGFAALTEQLLASEAAPRIVWAGDQAVTAPLEWPRERFFNLTGKTTLPELIPLISQARLCVCNDSGPMHLAAAVGTELVAIFGPTPPERFGPWPLSNPRHHVVRAPVAGLNALSVEDVFAPVAAALAGEGSATADGGTDA
ncbi:MAG: glycosyltransferase family 9 protein [Puniceicoccales bacterium]